MRHTEEEFIAAVRSKLKDSGWRFSPDAFDEDSNELLALQAAYALATQPAPLADAGLAELATLLAARKAVVDMVRKEAEGHEGIYMARGVAKTLLRGWDALAGLLARVTAAEAQALRWVPEAEARDGKEYQVLIANVTEPNGWYKSLARYRTDMMQCGWYISGFLVPSTVQYVLIEPALPALPAAPTVKGGQPRV